MAAKITTTQLEAFLDELLPADEAAAIEAALRRDRELLARLTAIHGRRDAGVHSLGEVWRRRRISCPSREQLGSFLLGAVDAAAADYVAFHLNVIGCRCCQANRVDLERRQAEAAGHSTARRKKYFQSSAGMLVAKR